MKEIRAIAVRESYKTSYVNYRKPLKTQGGEGFFRPAAVTRWHPSLTQYTP